LSSSKVSGAIIGGFWCILVATVLVVDDRMVHARPVIHIAAHLCRFQYVFF
jgi:hypothetical protein